MATVDLGRVVDYLSRSLAPEDAAGLTDRQLLARFVAGQEESAFAALVARHGAMVLAVCRRVLRHEQDAEDAFQATFLVLARKAASVRWTDTAGPWLYEVATRTALEARAVIRRRRARECQVEELPEPAVLPGEPQDWRPLLDQEVRRLPEKYRAAVVLCELEGRTRSEAARQLGLPEGTLSSRLAAARRMLAQRLARRGLVLSGAALAALSESTVSAALVGATVRGASLVTMGLAAEVPSTAAVLMKGVLKTMFLAKVKVVMAAVLIVGALGAGGFAYQTTRPAPARSDTDKASGELEALRKENELLKLNLRVVLEKVRTQEAEMRALEARALAGARAEKELQMRLERERYAAAVGVASRLMEQLRDKQALEEARRATGGAVDPIKEIEAALKALKEGRDKESTRRALEALDRARLAIATAAARKPGESPKKK
jgi:RNA polymerase sigma factor (sigma-70 family)